MRFSSAAGLVARLRRPLNSFGFVGPGRVSISPEGLTVSARSTSLLGMRHAARFIPVGEIHDVYREADAVQIHLRGPRQPYLRFWAKDAASASELVSLLPTRSTIEFDTALDEPPVRRRRVPLTLLAAIPCAFALVLALTWLSGYGPKSSPGPALSAPLRSPPARAPAPAPAPAHVAADLVAIASPAEVLAAGADLERFLGRIDELRMQYRSAYQALTEGTMSQLQFSDTLTQSLVPLWNGLESDLRRLDVKPGLLQAEVHAELLGVISNWRLALQTYAEDLRTGHPAVRPFEYMQRAAQYEQRSENLQSRLEARITVASPGR